MKRRIALTLTLMLVVCVAGGAQAEEIRLDLRESLAGRPNWNEIDSNTTRSNLVDYLTGSPTSAEVTTAGFDAFLADGGLWTAGNKDWVLQGVGLNAGFIYGGSSSVTFANLIGSFYRVEVAASNRMDFPEALTDITVNGGFADSDYDGAGEDGDDYPQGWTGHNNWLIWNYVTPTAGSVVVDMTFLAGDNGNCLNAVRLSQVAPPPTPEPTLTPAPTLTPIPTVPVDEIRLNLAGQGFPSLPNWNQLDSNTTLSNPVDYTTGSPTAAEITTAGFETFVTTASFWTAGDKDWVPESAGIGAGLIDSPDYPAGSVTFANLSGGTYRVEVVASISQGANSWVDITVNGRFADSDYDGTGENGDEYRQDGNGHNNWLIWNYVTSPAGSIVVDMTFLAGLFGNSLNAVRLYRVQTVDADEIRLDLTEQHYGRPNWNEVTSDRTLGGLIDYLSGSSTAAEVTTEGFDAGYGIVSEMWTAGDKDWVPEWVGYGAGFIAGGSGSVSFAHLSGASYRVEVVASSLPSFPDELVDITVNGDFADSDFDGAGENGDDYPQSGTGHNNWLIWNSVAPTAGSIAVNMTYLAGTYGNPINAVRLTRVVGTPTPGATPTMAPPVPSSGSAGLAILLISMATLLGVSLRRRRP